MNNLYLQVIERFEQLKPTNLSTLYNELKEATAALRVDVEERLDFLDTVEETSSDFALTMSSINELLQIIEVLIESRADVVKLEQAANKNTERVWKCINKDKLLRLEKGTGARA